MVLIRQLVILLDEVSIPKLGEISSVNLPISSSQLSITFMDFEKINWSLHKRLSGHSFEIDNGSNRLLNKYFHFPDDFIMSRKVIILLRKNSLSYLQPLS